MMMLVLFALLLSVASGQESWTIMPLGMNMFSIQQGAQASVTYTANVSTTLHNVMNGYLSWYDVTENVTSSQLANRPPGSGDVVRIAPYVYQASIPTSRPAVVFYGGVNSVLNFICNITVMNEFACTSGGSLIATFAAIGTENPDTATVMQLPASVILNTNHPSIDGLRQHLLDLLLYRAAYLRSFWDNGQSAVDNNKDRIDKAKIWGGGVMFLIAVAMEAVLIVTVILHSWTVYFAKFSRSTNFIIWLFIFFASQQVVSIVGGFPGWFAMFVVLVLYTIILSIVYGCTRRKIIKNGGAANGTAGAANGEASGHFDAANVTRVVPITAADLESGNSLKGDNNNNNNNNKPKPAFKWSSRPEELGTTQKGMLVALSIVVVVMLGICLIIFYCWSPMDYLIWSRKDNQAAVEFAPATVGKSTLLMYMYPRMATIMQFNTFCYYSTKFCGYWFNRTLDSDSDKQTAIYDNLIDLYTIDMNEYARPSYKDYVTVNDWFTRSLAPGARPIADALNPFLAVSPADCRLMAFENINSDLHVWLKGEEFSPETLLNVLPSEAAVFNGGTMVVARLAPADYHRFHSPVAAQVKTWTKIESTIFSVNADAARSGNKVYYNTRFVTILDSPQFGKVAYVAIGATCVGSVITSVENQALKKGDEMGVMQFGGSTVVLLFQPGKIKLDVDLLLNSRRSLETLIQMGARIGIAPQ